MTVSYDGSDFKGYQKQPRCRTVQGELEKALKKINGDKELESIDVTNEKETANLKVAGMFISIGLNAQSEMFKDILNLNDNHYVVTDECHTNYQNIFVAGDVREKSVRQLATAVNDGAIAATLAINYLKK